MKKSWWKWPLYVACLALLVWMVQKADPARLWSTLCQMPLTIALCILVWGTGYLFNAASFRTVLDGFAPRQRLSRLEVLRLTMSGYALNYITPFGLLGGEPYRILALRPTLGTRLATRSVVGYSLMHMGSHLIFWALALLWALCSHGWPTETATGTLQAFSLAGIVGYLDVRQLPPQNRYRALGLELLSRFCNVVEYWLIFRALGFSQLTYGDAFLCVGISSLFANLLFFAPLQMGTREGGIFLALQHLLPQTTSSELVALAVTISFATRLREFFWIAVGLLLIKIKKQK